MSDKPEEPVVPRQRLDLEYEDPHYHDEDEPLPPDEAASSGPRLSARGKASRKLPPRGHYEYED
jgi:hypothetical protein